MPLLRRSLLLVALVIQAAFGPAGLTLDVCHGRLQWAAPAGESCCGTQTCDEDRAESREAPKDACGCDHDHGVTRSGTPSHEPISLDEDPGCPTCFQVALEGSDDAFESRSPEMTPTLAFCQTVSPAEMEFAPQPVAQSCSSRAPPGAVQPSGLLPGTFPLRI